MAQTTKVPARRTRPDWQQQFVLMLPAIRQYATIRFRHRSPEEREELVAEVVALAFLMFARLVQRRKARLGFATPLAKYACRQVVSGRRLGSPLNVHDVTSAYCQRRKDISVEWLDSYDAQNAEWREIVVEDRRATPADIAATKIDFADWLGTLSHGQRRIAETLATGESTSDAARMFRVSAGRISQIRRELLECWQRFQGEPVTRAAMAVA